jgi:nitrate reductase gamma subunit
MSPIPADVSNTYMLLGYAVVVLILLGTIGFMLNRSAKLNKAFSDLSRSIPPAQDDAPPSR